MTLQATTDGVHRGPGNRRRAAAPVALGAAAALILLSGCDNLSYRRLDFDNTETARIDTIRVLPGAGDVVVRATGPESEVRIKRVVRYQGAEPDAKYEVKGSELVLDTECGMRCTVSYEVTAPAGVAVKGETSSGDVELTHVGAVELQVRSGDVRLSGATGPVRVEASSGNIDVSEATGAVTLRASSGDISARRVEGALDAEARSGNVVIEMEKPASVRAHATSGDVDVVVPAGPYRVRAHANSGDEHVTVTNDPAATLMLDVSTTSGDINVGQR
ncbi:DUF4097 family beta strand repeat-containing protein [Micromonospora globbae]|uniref:DUF4097 domain-containing protein n=1 Tax=Micromonospora globbae TaxID=1894969 RepID=A0ABZ1S946_9ACTN|nr:DUF4097 family beta strand repeat-containing protein [Micromonospora globbae]WTF85055.1 DUF4097 domain-containing protein [Micromonospora globbae]